MGLNSDIIQRISGDNEVLIPNGTDFTRSSGFFLSLPAAADVHYLTWGDQEITRSLPSGTHPVRVKKVFADNATEVYAIW